MADAVVVKGPPAIGVVLPSRESFSQLKSGAVALCARDFAKHSRFRDEITIVGAAECEYPDVRYVRLADWRRWWRRSRMAYALGVAAAAEAHGFTALEVQNRPYMIATLRRRLPGLKLALYLLNDPQEMDGSRTPAERRRLIEAADAVWCISAWVRERLLDGVDDPRGRTAVVFPGVAVNPVRQTKEKLVAYVGRVIAIKGVCELARAFERAGPRMPGWRLVVAGDDPDGLLSSWRVRLGGRMSVLGQIPHAQAMALFARAEIAAVPSVWREPFGRTAIEALASGCALVTSGSGGLAEIATGVAEIVRPDDLDGFANALVRLAADDGLRAEMQRKGMARAHERFDIGAATACLDEQRACLLGL